MDWDLPLLLGLAVAFAVVMYVVMDGFDLGIGILFPFAPDEPERSTMMNSIAPFWDGNETWLVLGGDAADRGVSAGLRDAAAGLLRAAADDAVRADLPRRRVRVPLSRRAPSAGSGIGPSPAARPLAAFCQGVVLGGFIDGHPGRGRRVCRRHVRFSQRFAVVCGLGLVAGYALLGATWLIVKTDGLTARSRPARRPRRAAGDTGLYRAGQHLDPDRVSAYRAALVRVAEYRLPVAGADPDRADRVRHLAAISSGVRNAARSLLSIALFLLAFLGLGISLWPYAVPYQATVWQAAASPPTLLFVAIGTAIVLPVVLGYMAFAYRVFRGKTGADTGYGH